MVWPGREDCGTLPAIDDPVFDVAAIRDEFGRAVAGLDARARVLAIQTLERLQPPSWTLEWYLPVWLGAAFRHDGDLVRRVVLSNVLGLVAVRLEDDLQDGEVGERNRERAAHVAGALLEAAIAIYRPLIPPESSFWPELDGAMAEWRSRSVGEPADADQWRSLARRGRPLKVGARALWLLADNPRPWGVLDRCLDHALVALARYDDVCDWEADLAAGRWNGFIASCGARSQTPGQQARNRSAVLLAMMTRGAARRGFEQVAAEARQAAVLAVEVGSPQLANHLREVADRAVAQGMSTEAHFEGAAAQATSLLFPGMPPRRTGGLAAGGP
jgi:hypothetical protein